MLSLLFTILISLLELYLISTNYGKVYLPVKSVNGNIGRGVKENYLLTKEKKLINICIDWKVETNENIRSLIGYGYMILYDKWQKRNYRHKIKEKLHGWTPSPH